MEKKRSVGVLIFVIIIFNFLFLFNHTKLEADETAKFEKVLSEYLNFVFVETEEFDEVEAKRTASQIWFFTQDFPNSKFADDARLIYIFTNFVNFLVDGYKQGSYNQKEIQNSIQYMQDMVNLYPDGKLEEFALQKIGEILSKDILESFPLRGIRIPYSYIVIYMRAKAAGPVFNDYQSMFDNFSVLQDKLGDNKKYAAILESDVYPSLAIAYFNLGRFEEAKKIAKETMTKFPDNEFLQQSMKGMVNKIDSKQ